jgi:uracil-DNA glycosylase
MPRTADAWSDHIAALRACRKCPGVQPPPVLGAVPGARVYLVGQAPGPKEMVQGRPFVFTAGTTLFRWFASIGVPEEEFRTQVYMAAVIRCFPGKLANQQGDRKPAREEIANCRPHQEAELRLLQPGLVIPVGKMAIEQFLPPSPLDAVVGRAFRLPVNGGIPDGGAFDAIPLPHPSGLSRWIQQPAGKARIREALALIQRHPAWVATFGRRKGPASG